MIKVITTTTITVAVGNVTYCTCISLQNEIQDTTLSKPVSHYVFETFVFYHLLAFSQHKSLWKITYFPTSIST